MKTSRYKYAIVSFGALGLAALLLVVGTLAFDAALNRLSLSAQRWITFAALVVPPIIGVVAGVVGLAARGHNKPLPALGLLLNLLFGLFFTGVLLIAG